jgi:molybdopterin synthase sulfur carrier subunit
MIVKILFFAAAKEASGAASSDLVLDDEATVGQLKQTLVEQHPALLHVLSRSTISVDHEYANDEKLLYHGAEVAILPPASGG